MSNWLRAQVSTEIKNARRDLFEKALANMGYKPDYSEKTVHGAYSYEASEKVDCVLRDKDGKLTTIGFSFDQGPKGEVMLKVSGDFFNCGFSGNTFMKRLGMQYNFEMSKECMEEMGYNIESVENKEHEIVFVGYRMAA